jgi:hypothetical protein
MPASSGTTTSVASTFCWARPRPPNRPARCCATTASHPNASRRKSCAWPGKPKRAARWAAWTQKRWPRSQSTSTPSGPGSKLSSAPDALTRALPACQRRRPARGKGPLTGLTHRRRRARRNAALPATPGGNAPLLLGSAAPGHIPFTPRAKKTLQLSLREAKALHDNTIGVQHLALALLAQPDGTVPVILSALGTPATSLRAAILDRYRKAS